MAINKAILSSMAIARGLLRAMDIEEKPAVECAVGDEVYCVNNKGVEHELASGATYVVSKVYGAVGKPAYIEIKASALDNWALGDYAVWRFTPVNKSVEVATLEYEEILSAQSAMETSLT
jgi:hypothetical protein